MCEAGAISEGLDKLLENIGDKESFTFLIKGAAENILKVISDEWATKNNMVSTISSNDKGVLIKMSLPIEA